MSLVTNPRHVVKVYPAIKKMMPDGGGGIGWSDEPSGAMFSRSLVIT